MKRKYYVYDTEGNWLGIVLARTRAGALQEAKIEYKNYKKIVVKLT